MRPEQLHVAQQIRRDKLRIQNHMQQEFPNNNIEELLSLHQPPQGFNNMDLLQLRNAANNNNNNNNNMLDDETGHYSTNQLINTFSTTSNPLHRNPLDYELAIAEPSSNINRLGYYYTNETNIPNSFLTSHEQEQLNSNDIFKSSTCSSEMASLMHHHSIWGGVNSHNTNTNSIVPIFHENQANPHQWTNRSITVENNNNNMGGSFFNDYNPQGLNLSLSSNSQSKQPSSTSTSNFDQGSLNIVKVSKEYVKPIHQEQQQSSTSSIGFRNVGPLGPFTGYATILKNSRFLKPCQELLEQCCCCENVPKWVSRDVVVDDESGGVVVSAKGSTSNSGSSCSMLYGSKEKENSNVDGGIGNNFCLSSSTSSSRPECQKNKAQLLFMHEEVTRRYKQYHQQMQMVVSSFESVAGLSSATPYISLALKSLSKHFKCLKNAITDQLKHTCQVLGEDFSILPTTTSSSSKFDSNNNNMTRLRGMNQSIQKNKSGGNSNVDFVEPQQHVWRPQRGLPERSVAILKAWLFEHFLHPYPTDTDKHMLATQTGLSRNQVSNWFINARVRVWKPMVEEIHMLESKGTTEVQNQNNSKNEASNVLPHEKQFQCLEVGSSSGINNVENEEQWNNIQEKRFKLENDQITSNMDTTVMGFMPYQRGSVSLTLGLRQGVENAQHQQQQLQQEVELRHQYGGHMFHDFVG
ncbi:BEL1-like homeodomain protein 8 isoform X2 [Trifolium pratense]|uniref:BEL1-like homeodomain protein 8 isoform X2 n=2 Tax=Trifolium pratense TaxID=57577 RepID=UPI001E691E21|nr:BEL1-like homeodomain protein 8 isoform X2 [Trifolium pratense]